MPEKRLERARRAYDRIVDMRPHGCRIIDVGSPDHRTLNRVWGVPASSPLSVGAGQTGKTLTVTATSAAYRITQAQLAHDKESQ